MNFPGGVCYNPGQLGRWITITTKTREALITIDLAPGYTVKDRAFKENFHNLFSDGYKELARRYHLI